jgi:hypothetical protein
MSVKFGNRRLHYLVSGVSSVFKLYLGLPVISAECVYDPALMFLMFGNQMNADLVLHSILNVW